MSVYVDDMQAPYGRMLMSHMIADTPEELREMALRIGVRLRWLQKSGTYQEHFDVCQAMRAKAVKLGAIEIKIKELGKMLRERAARAATETPK